MTAALVRVSVSVADLALVIAMAFVAGLVCGLLVRWRAGRLR